MHRAKAFIAKLKAGMFLFQVVIPAKAGIQKDLYLIPVCPPCAGMMVRLSDRSTNYIYCQLH